MQEMKSLLILYTRRLLGPICLQLGVIDLLKLIPKQMNLGDPSDPLILNLAQSFTRTAHQLDYVTIDFWKAIFLGAVFQGVCFREAFFLEPFT